VDKSLLEIARTLRRRQIFAGVVAGLAGFLFVASNITSLGTNLRTGGVEDLRGLVIDRAGTVAILENKVSQTQDQVSEISAKKISPEFSATLLALENITGLAAVTGSALQVSLSDAPRNSDLTLPAGVGPDDLVVHQQDVQSVVNAFWRAGATAVQVMDQRIISTSAIRCVGNTLLLQGRVYSPPFVVTAVGNVSDLQDGLATEPGVQIYREYVETLNLGWQVKILNQTTLPAWQGAIN